MKPQIVDVDHSLYALRDFNIDAAVVNKKSRIHKIRLALSFTASQTRQQTVRLDQPDARLRQTNSISNPVRKLPTGKIRIVKDRVKARGAFVSWIAIALRPKKRTFETQVITIDRKLSGSHVRSDLYTSRCDRVVLVVT